MSETANMTSAALDNLDRGARFELYRICAATRPGMAVASRTGALGRRLARLVRGLAPMGFSCSERLAGTYLVPYPWLTVPSWPMVEQIARAGLTALAAPPEFLALDKVAAVVLERYAQVLWIRLQTADADPGALLVTLLGAAARLDAEASQVISEDVARHARHGEWQVGL